MSAFEKKKDIKFQKNITKERTFDTTDPPIQVFTNEELSQIEENDEKNQYLEAYTKLSTSFTRCPQNEYISSVNDFFKILKTNKDTRDEYKPDPLYVNKCKEVEAIVNNLLATESNFRKNIITLNSKLKTIKIPAFINITEPIDNIHAAHPIEPNKVPPYTPSVGTPIHSDELSLYQLFLACSAYTDVKQFVNKLQSKTTLYTCEYPIVQETNKQNNEEEDRIIEGVLEKYTPSNQNKEQGQIITI